MLIEKKEDILSYQDFLYRSSHIKEMFSFETPYILHIPCFTHTHTHTIIRIHTSLITLVSFCDNAHTSK